MKTRRVLIIEGDPKDLKKHSGMLSEARYAVLGARDCTEATGILKKHRGKVAILSELAVNGECMVAFMKKTLEEYPFLPFLFLVSSPSLDSSIETLKAGASDYLRKPVSKDILCASVTRSLERMEAMLEAEKLDRDFRKWLSRSKEEAQSARTLSSFKGFMISMAAHDFRTILTVLDGYLQFMQEKCWGCTVSAAGGMLPRTSRTVARLLTMANTLLDYEAAETGRIRMEIGPFPLDEVLSECLAFYKPYADQKRIDLSLCLEGSGAIVKGDREKVLEILDNLLYNALKFTPSDGSICLAGKEEKGYAMITVSDSGPGMSKEKLKNLFNKEIMVATLDAHSRLGLGMSICKRLVEAQNGKIRVSSIVGKGTTVSILLPLE